jgi:general secretion pathway protein F
MPLFRYKELSKKKTRKARYIDADDLAAAKIKLRALKIIAEKITPHDSFRKKFSLDKKHLLMITKDLYYLLHSNLPLYESLLTLEDKYRNHKIYPMVLDLTDSVKYGRRLSTILNDYEKAFSSIYISMVRSAEKSGHLDKAFLELSIMIETSEKWQKKIRGTLTYPLFLLSFSFAILFGLFLFIIPSMAELFEDRALHPLTSAVLTISNLMCSNLYALGGIILAIFLLIGTCIYNKKVSIFFKKYLYKIGVIKDLTTKIAIERFTTSLYNLLESTVPILEALELAKGSLNHPYLEEDVDNILKRVRKGEKFSQAIGVSKYFPKIVSKMISTGEHSGSIAPILKHISALFHEEVKTALEKFTALLQPILLLLIGIIVGVVLLAVLIPLTDVSSLL